jgi:hypothetical protein
MYLMVGETKYTQIKDISFAPETDISGDSLPINQFELNIVTPDSIAIGQYAELYDDMDKLWARYWIVYAEHITLQTLRVRAKSPVLLLSQRRLDAELWTAKPAPEAIAEAMQSMPYTLDASFDNVTLTGFVPSQESRARIQWICFAIGAYVRTFFNDKIEILPIDETEELIPPDKTYYKPSVTFNDYVTTIQASAYSFTHGTPDVTDEYVEDSNGNYYIVNSQFVRLHNPDVPASAPEKTITIDGVYLVNNDNVSSILTYLSQMYFKRTEVDLDVINNGEYEPGAKVIIHVDDETMYAGRVASCDFAFGLQAKSKMHMVPTDMRESSTLDVTYTFNGVKVGRYHYRFPVDYAYSITCPYIDYQYNGHRYILRPTVTEISGTMTSEAQTITVPYVAALDYSDETLTVISVDDFTTESGIVTIT